MKPDAGTLAAGYGALFDPLLRAAHIACLEHARHTRDDGWPTVETCLAFARVFGVPGAELAAFFGFIGHRHGGRTIWVDALRGPVPSYTARQRATREQAAALGFVQSEVIAPASCQAANSSSRRISRSAIMWSRPSSVWILKLWRS